jgi:hypothetical protein
MVRIKVVLDKKSSQFIDNYIKAGWATSKSEAVRHSLLWWMWCDAHPERMKGKKFSGYPPNPNLRKAIAKGREI